MAEITKMWIADKIREIMKHKPIDKIRVMEICRAADIESPTFYYHFKDKYPCGRLSRPWSPSGSITKKGQNKKREESGFKGKFPFHLTPL